MRRLFEEGAAGVLLAVLILLNGWALRTWVKKDTNPLSWDESIHTRVAMDYREGIAKEGPLFIFKPAYFNYPPLYHLTVIPFLNTTADIADAASVANFFYLALLLVAVYLIGRNLSGSWAGFAAAALVSGYPIMAEMARPAMVDLALSAWVAVMMWCLLKSDHFAHRLWSIGFGLSLGLGTMTKWTAPGYVLFPVLWSLVPALKNRRWKEMGFAFGIAALLTVPWYLANFVPVLSRIGHVSNLIPATGEDWRTRISFLWYVFSLPEQMNLLFVLLFVAGAVLAFFKRRFYPILLWFAGSLFLFTLLHNRNVRYTMPALPAAALLTTALIPSARTKLMGGLGALGVAGFLVFQFLSKPLPEIRIGHVNIPLLMVRPASVSDWRHEEVIRKIDELRPRTKPLARVVTVSNAAYFHSTSLNVSRRALGVNTFEFRGASKRRWTELDDFILWKTGDVGPGFTLGTINECVKELSNPPAWLRSTFREVARWPLPDHSEAILYQCNPSPVRGATVDALNISLNELKMPRVSASGVQIRAVPLSPQDTALGRLKELTLSAESVSYRDILFGSVSLRFMKPQINLHKFLETGDIELLSLEEMVPAAVIPAEGLLSYMKQKVKWLENPTLRFENSTIEVAGKASSIPLRILFDVWIDGPVLKTRLKRVSAAGIPLPVFFLRSASDQALSLEPSRDTPFHIRIGSIQGLGDQLKVAP